MKEHILVVDDEQNIREVCKELLEEEGYKVSLAIDGQDALVKLLDLVPVAVYADHAIAQIRETRAVCQSCVAGSDDTDFLFQWWISLSPVLDVEACMARATF